MYRIDCSISEILVLEVVQPLFQEAADEDFRKLMVTFALALGVRQANSQKHYIGVIRGMMIWQPS